jgi:hypothetical protein
MMSLMLVTLLSGLLAREGHKVLVYAVLAFSDMRP